MRRGIHGCERGLAMAGNAHQPLPGATDDAILRLARALARQAAREDHERDQQSADQARRDLSAVFDRSAE
jgi:hypothetical protein